MNKMTALAVTAAVLVSACSTDPFTGEQKVSNTAIGAGLGAATGALAGALIGHGSSHDKRKAALIGAGIGAVAGGGIGLYMDQQEAALRQRLQNSGVSVTRVGDQIILNMPSNITFDTDRADLNPQFYDVLNSVAIVLNEFNRSIVDVDGHTDSDGSDQYNIDLSTARADAVARYLAGQGIDTRRLSVQGYGESRPVADNRTAAGKAQNRRVEIRIVPLTA